MKRTLPIIIFTLIPVFIFAQDCTLEDASGCVCEDDSEACYLLPNINLSRNLLEDASFRIENPGVLEISVSTPNIGYGPLAIVPSNNIICGTDTIFNAAILVCPDGSQPRQLVRQRIYSKKENEMKYEDRDAGYMAYHPTHGHLHFNNWNNYTLRIEISGQSDPLRWPIVGERTKMGFCLEDTGTCEFYDGYCRDEDGNTLLSDDIPNYGLGGPYNDCNYAVQGISVGAVDIYYLTLDGMEISIPKGTCNGKYKLVVEVDPLNQIVESNENDNIEVVDVELTQQIHPDSFPNSIAVTGGEQVILCNNDPVYLSVPRIGSHYLWSNGDTTHIATVTEPGLYSCIIQTPCGEVVSNKVPVFAEVCNTDCINLRIGVWMEGPYNEEKNEMITDLNTKLQMLPGQHPVDTNVTPTPPGQPYCAAPWNYNGIEGLGLTAGVYSDDVVDWVLVSLRDSTTKDTEILQAAALLHNNGTIKFPNTCVLPKAESPDSAYIVVEHRNHTPVMTPFPVVVSNNQLKYDFRTSNSYNIGGSGQKPLHDSTTWVMFTGDGYTLDELGYDINGNDKTIWVNDNGRFNVYVQGDYNLDGDVNGLDKAYWSNNNGRFSAVPK